MKEERNFSRRRVLTMAVASAFTFMSCAVQSTRPEPIVVDTSGVKDLKGLIQTMKKAGAGLLPSSASDEAFFKAIARSFVDNARAAAEEHGVPIPSWILDRLPAKKSTWDKPDKTDAVIFITILGVAYVLPKLFLFSMVLASILVMTNYILEELRKPRLQST